MRLWSIHPKYLDKHGLIALWREGLLAQKALSEEASIPHDNLQLICFKEKDNPIKAIGSYLSFVASEGAKQGCRLNHEKILYPNFEEDILDVKSSQLITEQECLKTRLKLRDKEKFYALKNANKVEANPVFNLQ